MQMKKAKKNSSLLIQTFLKEMVLCIYKYVWNEFKVFKEKFTFYGKTDRR